MRGPLLLPFGVAPIREYPSAANLPADCINLGQGYMNFAPPAWVTKAAEEALATVAPNHYSHPRGRIRLREAIKSFYGPQLNRDLDVESEILVTSGANEGMFTHHPRYSKQFLDQMVKGSTPFLPHSSSNGTKSLCLNRSSISTCPL